MKCQCKEEMIQMANDPATGSQTWMCIECGFILEVMPPTGALVLYEEETEPPGLLSWFRRLLKC